MEGNNMKGIKVGVIVKKQCVNTGDKTQRTESEKKQNGALRVADPEAHQKFVNNLFSVIKS
jgi:hypothetical protein